MKWNPLTLICMLAILGWSVFPAAAIPSLINFQGRLLDTGGNPVSGTVTVEVSLFTVDMGGVPNSPDAIYRERFMPSDDGKALDYTLTIDDPATFTEAPVFSKQWLWVSDATVEPYNCLAGED